MNTHQRAEFATTGVSGPIDLWANERLMLWVNFAQRKDVDIRMPSWSRAVQASTGPPGS